MELKSPRKKFLRPPPYNAPLPICYDFSQTLYSEYEQPLFTGRFNGLSVVVDDSSEMIALYNKGFFGKGSLSRSCPQICKKKNIVKILNESQWKRRKLWSESLSNLINITKPSSESNSNPDKNEENYECDKLEKQHQEGTSSTQGDNNKMEVDECTKNDEISELSITQENSVNKVENENDSKDPDIGNIGVTISKIPEKLNADTLDENEVLVISDLAHNIDEPLKNLNPHIEKEEFTTVFEVLHLSLEEAFFLSYALNCLEVINLAGQYLTCKEMWNLFQEAEPDFIEKYVVYHHFRSKGWVVKSGIKYGGDFLIYKKGPPYFHASCVVTIQILNPDGTKAKENNPLTWGKVNSLNRTSVAAMKEVLLCEVMRPDLPKEKFQDPLVLKDYTVNSLMVKKWQALQERSKEQEEDD